MTTDEARTTTGNGHHGRRQTAGGHDDGARRVTAAAENYLSAIYALTAERKTLIGARLAQHLGVSPPSITQTLQRLVKQGYVVLLDRGDRKEITLTESGRRIGESVTRRHRLIERWLQSELKLTSTEAHEAAHRLESGFTDDLLDRLLDSIGRPSTCPHGNPIPGIGTMDHSGKYLDDVVPGEEIAIGRITEEAEADLDLLAYLERHQVVPHTKLRIVAVDKLSGAVTAMTPSNQEIRLERRSASLIYIVPAS